MTKPSGKLFTRFVRWVGYDLGISPNQITIGRLLFFVPGWLLWVFRHEVADMLAIWWQAVGAIAFLIVTIVIIFDIVDGALARETGQVSKEGKVLDPAVDKFITYSTLVLFWSTIDKMGLGILFFLDIASTFLRGLQVQGANEFGKKKALSQNISKIFFALAVLAGIAQFNTVGNLFIWAAVVLASVSVGLRIVPVHAKSSIYLLIPQCLTLSNLACGFLAIWYATNGAVKTGVLFNFAAMVFDLADGAVARRLGVTSRFGKHFDTVADLVSFGFSPAILGAALLHWSPLSIVLGVLYIVSTGVRLYDYGRSKDITPSGFFRGLPSPAGAWLVCSIVLWSIPALSLAGLAAAAVLMCFFSVHWQHFNRILPTMRIFEIIIGTLLGLIPAVLVTPVSFLTGPIIVYIFSPLWRKPDSAPVQL